MKNNLPDDYIACPKCNTEFYAEVWQDGECPSCHTKYHWYEAYYENGNDSDWWADLEWY